MKESEFNQDLDEIEKHIFQRVGSVKQAKALGIEIVEIGTKGITLVLPYNDFIVGNPDTGVIHGGALTTLMDQCLGSSVGRALYPLSDITPTIDLRVDHIRAAEPKRPVYAYCEVYRITSSVVFTKGVAYQDDVNDPISNAVASFMRLGIRADFSQGAVSSSEGGENK